MAILLVMKGRSMSWLMMLSVMMLSSFSRNSLSSRDSCEVVSFAVAVVAFCVFVSSCGVGVFVCCSEPICSASLRRAVSRL